MKPADTGGAGARRRLCVITAMKDCAALLPFYRDMVDAFDHPPARVIVSVNDSDDGTAALLRAWGRPGLEVEEVSLDLPFKQRDDYGPGALVDRTRRLAQARNLAIEQALRHDDWDVALMQDAAKYSPPALPRRLIEDGADIVAPLIMDGSAPTQFYDIWCYRDLDGRPFLNSPPHTHRPAPRVEVEAVGGIYAVRREVLEAGCRLAGTDGSCCDSVPLCRAARAAGFRVYVRMTLVAYAFKYPDVLPRPMRWWPED